MNSDETRWCPSCKTQKPASDFGRHLYCTECWTAYHSQPGQRLYVQPTSQTLSRYDITKEEYQALFVKQGGCCAICNGVQTSGQRLCVDHDHATGAVRGLLCYNCNTGIGRFNDDPVRLRAAAQYLSDASAKSRM